MQPPKTMTDSTTFDGVKLWDEILKAIVTTMPSQLFPLFKEVYGREYPNGTSIVLLNTETSSFQENNKEPPGSSFMDIALLVAGTDYYHLECQMKNDKEMVIRMFAYDLRFAMNYSKTIDWNTGEVTIHFPHSAVLYPEKNNAIPNHLQCRIIFQDNSEHIYKIPTVRIQTYSLEEIRQKHLTLFIPYTILRLRPKLKTSLKHQMTRKELTEFVEEVILVLKRELHDKYLTETEFQDYVRLFQFAAERVLSRHPQFRKEVKQMTEPLIILPSMVEKEWKAKYENVEKEWKAKFDTTVTDMTRQLEELKSQLAEKDAVINDLMIRQSH